MVDPDMEPLIIDAGSDLCKVGFSFEATPREPFKSIVGRPKHPGIMVGMDAKYCFVGLEAQAKRGILKMKYPIEHGMVTNWNDMEKIWHHSFYNELRVCTPEEHPTLLTEVPFNPRRNREKMAAIMFETFELPGLYVANQAVLSLYASGRTNGLVLDSGHDVTHTVPIYAGCVINHPILRMNIGGEDISEYLRVLLNERGYDLFTTSEREIVRHIKETITYVSQDYETELEMSNDNKSKSEVEYEFPDGSMMTVGTERFRAPEIMFQPSFLGSEVPGLHQMTIRSLQKIEDISLRKCMFENIVLSGGSTMFDGMRERVEKEVRVLAPKKNMKDVKVHGIPERNIGAWLGGKILVNLDCMRKMWITKSEYDEKGASIIHRKCFTGGSASSLVRVTFEFTKDEDLLERVSYCCDVKMNCVSVRFLGGQNEVSISKCFFML